MAGPVIRQNRTGDAAEDRRALDTIADLRGLLAAPFLKGRQIDFSVKALADEQVAHGLGRTPVGWMVIDITGASHQMYRKSWDARFIVFVCPVAATYSLWVW